MFQGLDSKTPETIDCLKSMSLSGWHPAPFDRQMAGDIMYLNVVTLENETYEVTSSASGFFVNASTALEFNPAPAKESFHSHNLITLLTKFSPTFAKNFPVLKQSVMSKDPYEYILAPYPVYPWRVSAQKREYDLARQMDATMNVTDVIETMTSRDWNEDIQSARELPRSSVQERVIREQAICKSHSDFVEASMKGVVAIVQKSIPPVNPMDPELSHMFINNNIFFSQGYDSRDQYERYGGEEAAHVGVSKDIDGVRMVSNLDMENMFTLGTAVVDYKGIRTVCQTIVPGILKKAVTGESSVKYGSVDSGKEVSFDESFHESLRSASRLLHVAEHSVNDINGKEVSLFTSVDTKGILGTDSRRYLLDLYRMTPVDICFLEETQNEENADTKYPHQMTLLRPELIDLYYESKIREYVRDHQELQQKAKEEGKTDDSVETAENPMLNVPSLLLNTDAFTKIALSGEPEQIKEQEQQIRDVSEFLNTKMIAQFVLEMANYPTNIPIDSEQLTKVLHSRGINMRYLGKITNLIKATEAPNLAYLRDLCELEMLARAAKKVMRELLAPVPMSLVSTCISHFFNCLFSSGDAELRLPLHASLVKLESYNFEKLTPATLQSRLVAEIKKRFRYEFSLEMPTASPLALLRAICLKVGIQVEAKSYDFTATSTFAVSDILNIYPVAKHSEPKALFAEQVLEHGLEALMRKEDTDGLDMLREAVSMFEQVLGPIHPETARVNAQFALIKANQGNMDEARYYQKKSLLGYERSVGIDDPSTLQQYVSFFNFFLENYSLFFAIDQSCPVRVCCRKNEHGFEVGTPRCVPR